MMEPVFILEELTTIPLRGPVQERRVLKWRCPTDALEVPIRVQAGRVWSASTCPLCRCTMSRRQAQRTLREFFAYAAWERTQMALIPLVVLTQPTIQPVDAVEVGMPRDQPDEREYDHERYLAELGEAVNMTELSNTVGNPTDRYHNENAFTYEKENETMAQLNGSTIDTTATETPTTEESTGSSTMLASAGKAVWNTVAMVAYGAGVLTGAALLWGAAEVAKRVLNNRAAASEEQQ